MKQIFLIIAAIAFISCCGTSKSQENNQETVNPVGRYQIANVKGATVTSNEVVINFTGNNRISGMSGCNNFSAEYTVNDGKVSFSPVTATKRYCEGGMETEKAIIRAISNTKRMVSASENEVILLSEDGEELLRARRTK